MMKTTLYIVFPVCLVGCTLTAEQTSRAFGGRAEPILSYHQERGNLPEGVPFSYDRNLLTDDESETIVTTSGSRFGEANFSYPERALLSNPGICSGIQIEDMIPLSVIGIAPKQGPPAVWYTC